MVGLGGTLGMAMIAVVSLRVAALFGAGVQLDGYLVGVSGPAILLSLTGAVITSFLTPRLSVLAPPAAARRAGEWALIAFVLALVVAGIAALANRWIVAILAPGLSAHGASIAGRVLTIYTVSLPATLAATVYGAYGFANGRVWAGGAASAAFGVSWLSLLFVPTFSRSGAAVAAAGVIASQVQLLVAFLGSGRTSSAPWPWPRWRVPARPGAALAGVAAVMTAAAIGKTNLVLDPMLGSLAGHGAVSKLSLATRLTILLVVICGQGPALSLLGGRRSAVDTGNPLAAAGIGVTILISAGLATAVAISFTPVASLVLGHGQFSGRSAAQVGRLVEAYAPYVVLTATAWSLESILFSLGSTWRIAMLNVPGLLANVALSAALLPWLGLVARPIGAAAGAALYLAGLAIAVQRMPGAFHLADAVPTAAAVRLVTYVAIICGIGVIGGNALAPAAAAWSLAAMATSSIVVLVSIRSWLASNEPPAPLREHEPATLRSLEGDVPIDVGGTPKAVKT